jgi:hypothetical protein
VRLLSLPVVVSNALSLFACYFSYLCHYIVRCSFVLTLVVMPLVPHVCTVNTKKSLVLFNSNSRIPFIFETWDIYICIYITLGVFIHVKCLKIWVND